MCVSLWGYSNKYGVWFWRHCYCINMRQHVKQLDTFRAKHSPMLSPHGQSVIIYLCISLIPAWVSNNIRYKVLDEITYPFPNFNGATVEVWGWMSNFISHCTEHGITYPCLSPVLYPQDQSVNIYWCISLVHKWMLSDHEPHGAMRYRVMSTTSTAVRYHNGRGQPVLRGIC